MKKKLIALLGMLALLGGCGGTAAADMQSAAAESVIVEAEPSAVERSAITVTDSTSRTVELEDMPQNVFSLSSSFTEIWMLAGGTVSGVTNDALSDRDLGLPEDILVLGTVKDPNVEILLAEQPDFVILSEDIASHRSISETLQKSDIPHYIAKVETLEDYIKVLGDFTAITGDRSSLSQNGEQVEKEVAALLSRLPQTAPEQQKTALFLRAFSSDVKVKARDHTVCYILEDIGVGNIADKDGFPLEELSVEAVLESNPDYVFIVAMGDEDAANAYLEQSLFASPAWNSLSAAQNGNVIILPKSLYHYKPNNRWGEAYETILQIIYPEIYAKN